MPIGHLSNIHIGQVSNGKIPQVPVALGGFLLYTSREHTYITYDNDSDHRRGG
jgi:hypothetical protein